MPGDLDQLETRHVPATPATFTADTIRIRVPPAFQAYLVRQRKWIVAIALPAAALVPFAFYGFRLYSVLKSLNEYVWILVELLAFLIWLAHTRNPWFYEFGDKDAKLINLEKLGWAWAHLSWRENNYVAVERSHWRGLPAIHIKSRSRAVLGPKQLTLVYSPDDEPQIEQIVPFMQRHGTLISEGSWYQPS